MRADRYRVRGRVQGVGFRYFIYGAAQSLGIKGWVKNLTNGDVEIHAEGNEESVSAFRSKIESGPPLARVIEVDVESVDARLYEDFSILY